MYTLLLRFVLMLLSASLVFFGGCVRSSQPSNFNVLTPLASSERLPPLPGGERGLSLGVGPVTLPPYLDRPEIVTRPSQYVLGVANLLVAG